MFITSNMMRWWKGLKMNKKRVFLIGNGESRKSFNLNLLKDKGVVYGCNGLYRDYTPDAITCVDPGIMHEIYDSGYAKSNTVYYRGWTPIPAMMYDDMVNTHKQDMKTRLGSEPKIIESEKPEGTQEFVIHGSTALWQKKILEEERPYKGVGANIIFISWLHPEDKVRAISDYQSIGPDMKTGDLGYSAGPTALSIACLVEKPDEVFLIGCDLYSNSGKFNNMYKGTNHYEREDIDAVIPQNWLNQYHSTFLLNSDTDFYKVNEKSHTKGDLVNRKIDEWDDLMNIHYITQEELINRFLI